MTGPSPIDDKRLRFDNFGDNDLFSKKPRLPAMGWNSWNAFGSGNTEELTKAMILKIKELGLDELGYTYVVLDDGCYRPGRVNGHLQADDVKFPSGFKAMADLVHTQGLKFGMYNDIGTRLCSGAEVGIYGFEKTDCEDYIKWEIDFIKVDNCYYMWDNATFANPENAKYSYAPNIKSIEVGGRIYDAAEAVITGTRASVKDGYVTSIGTFDGTAPDHSPSGLRSSELIFDVEAAEDGMEDMHVTYATGAEEGVGQWLQIAAEDNIIFDGLLPATGSPEDFETSQSIPVNLKKGINKIRIMNHRRQENTLHSYTEIRRELENAGDRDIVFSICEWGKTQPQNWGHKVGDSWRILNDITFQVGSDGDHGTASWESDYTTSITSQYNKAVIMDEYAGLGKGWNDPDMLVIGMNGIDMTMCLSHMAMWCMMNSPLMLGLDLRRVNKGDDIYNIISNKDLIALDQDPLGIQAKRIFSTAGSSEPDKEYIRDNKRIDILAKPLENGDIALGFFNLDQVIKDDNISTDIDTILKALDNKAVSTDALKKAASFMVKDLITGGVYETPERTFSSGTLAACGCKVIRISPVT
ncbi:alpha-galactosidase [Butyrivibrio sp. AE2032]|uniref:alpha-galactosidase n=1 Tax=Butyrivibrio sp. AE2032 TaxID=1458463 RepID=UPI00068E9BA3|nr:alpha-galactosidase [Butyrivibrio sp. AE2032]